MKRAGLKIRLALAWLWFRRVVLRRPPATIAPTVPPDFLHVYVGPANVWGLKPGLPCKVIRAWGGQGGVKIQTIGGRVWTVHRREVERA